jgi:integral membrane sensor domain MASE1
VAGVIGASLAINLLGGTSIFLAFAFAICNASEAVLAAWLIEHWSGPTFRLDKLRHVVALFVAAGVAPAVASAGSAVAMTLLGPSTAPMLSIWRVWFVADSLGIASTAPLMIGLVAVARDTPSWRELSEGALAVLVIVVTNGIALVLLAGPWSLITPASFLVPRLLWRFPLSAGICRSGRIRNCGNDRMDNNPCSRSLRRSESADRHPYRCRSDQHPRDYSGSARSHIALCPAAAERSSPTRGFDCW